LICRWVYFYNVRNTDNSYLENIFERKGANVPFLLWSWFVL